MRFLKLALAAGMVAASASSFAGPIATNTWIGFCFDPGSGNEVTDGCKNQADGSSGSPFTFSLSGPALLKVTDAFVFGDTFDVFVNSVLSFTTGGGSHVATTTDPDEAFDGGSYDKGSVLLGAGNYSVGIFTKSTPGGLGGAYMQVLEQGVVPTPGTMSLVALGLLAALTRRRKQA